SYLCFFFFFFFSSRRRHTRSYGDWSSDVCSSDLGRPLARHRRRRVAKRAASAPHEPDRREASDERRRTMGRRHGVRAEHPAPDEIGRASCRERVEECEVGGAGNKKTTEQCGKGGE